MQSISASIVVLAGLGCLAAGGFIGHKDTQAFVMTVGGGVAAGGLFGWFGTLRKESASTSATRP